MIEWLKANATQIGVFFTGFSAFLAFISLWRNYSWNRRKSAMDAISELSSAMSEVDLLVAKIPGWSEGSPIDLEVLQEIFSKNPELEMTAKRILDMHENLANGVLEGIYSERTIRSSRRTDIIMMFRRFSHFIEARRRNIHPTAYDHLEAISRRWAKPHELDGLPNKSLNQPPEPTGGFSNDSGGAV